MGFSRQEYWSGCHLLLQEIFPTKGSHPGLLHGQADSTAEPPGRPPSTPHHCTKVTRHLMGFTATMSAAPCVTNKGYIGFSRLLSYSIFFAWHDNNPRGGETSALAPQRDSQSNNNTHVTALGLRQCQAVPGQGHDDVALLTGPVDHHLIVGIIETNLKEIKPTQELGPRMSDSHHHSKTLRTSLVVQTVTPKGNQP